MDVSQFWRMMKRPGHGTKCTLSTFVHERGCHPEFRMGDGAPAITKAGEELFADCDQCEDSDVLEPCSSCCQQIKSVQTSQISRQNLS